MTTGRGLQKVFFGRVVALSLVLVLASSGLRMTAFAVDDLPYDGENPILSDATDLNDSDEEDANGSCSEEPTITYEDAYSPDEVDDKVESDNEHTDGHNQDDTNIFSEESLSENDGLINSDSKPLEEIIIEEQEEFVQTDALMADAVDSRLPARVVPITELPDFEEYIPIHNREELEAIDDAVGNPVGWNEKKYYLANDIDLGDDEWTPLFSSSYSHFCGVFDGQGHVIRNLKSGDNNAALFYRIGDHYNAYRLKETAVKNLVLENISFIQNNSTNQDNTINVGALACYIEASGNVQVEISNIYVSGTIKGSYNAGGLIGHINMYRNGYSTTVSDCISDVMIELHSDKNCSAGGITSHATGEVVFINCHNRNHIEANHCVAGIVGSGGPDIYMTGSKGPDIRGCSSFGNITTTKDSQKYENNSWFGEAAGIISNGSSVTITDCQNAGSIQAPDRSGGIVSSLSEGTITKCQNHGIIDGVRAGGIAGFIGESSTNTFYVKDIKLSHCNNYGTVGNGENTIFAGGIAGELASHKGSLDSCKNYGTIKAVYDHYTRFGAGGVIGGMTVQALSQGTSGNGRDIEGVYTVSNVENHGLVDSFCSGGIVGSWIGTRYNAGMIEAQEDSIILNAVNTGAIVNGAGIVGKASGHLFIRACRNEGAVSGNHGAGILWKRETTLVGSIDEDKTYIDDCINTGNITVNGNDYIGGIAGSAASVTNCINEGTITAVLDPNVGNVGSHDGFVGGIAGQTTGEVNGCKNFGDINGGGAGIVDRAETVFRCMNYGDINGGGAGIVGDAKAVTQCGNYGEIDGWDAFGIAASAASIDLCSNWSHITGKGMASGIAGNCSIVKNCYNAGTVRVEKETAGSSGEYIASGIVCRPSSSVYDDLTGLRIVNCYNVGSVYVGPGTRGILLAGGLVGSNHPTYHGQNQFELHGNVSASSHIEAEWNEPIFSNDDNHASQRALGNGIYGTESKNNLWREDGIGDDAYTAGNAVPPLTLYDQETYLGLDWDFDTVWEIAPGGGLPVLQWEELEVGPMMDSVREATGTGIVSQGTDQNIKWTLTRKLNFKMEPTPWLFLRIEGIGTIPDYTEGAQPWAEYNDKICSIEFGSGITGIGAYALSGLTYYDVSIGLTNKIQQIKEGAFKNSTGLRTITIPRTVVYIQGEWDAGVPREPAFTNCTNLTIKCYKRSEGHSHAVKNNISYVIIGQKEYDVFYGEGKKTRFNKSVIEFLPQDATQYSVELADVLMHFSYAAYHEEDVRQSYEEQGFYDYKTYNYYYDGEGKLNPYDKRYGEDNVAYTIGRKKDDINQETVFITIRGSVPGFDIAASDWRSNLNYRIPTAGWGKHHGFETAADKVYINLRNFLGNLPKAGVNYVITGHSRGAAVANLLAVRLVDEGVPNTSVYDYNFACPDVAVGFHSGWNSFGKFSNIFNLCNRKDPVSLIPGAVCGVGTAPGTAWGKYGITHWFTDEGINTIDPDSHGQEFYRSFFKRRIHPSKFTNNLDDVMSDFYRNFYGFLGKVLCPVDVEIYNSRGEIIASVINNEADYHGSTFGDVIILQNGDEKYFYIRGEEPVEFRLSGYGSGNMTYSLAKGNLITGEISEEKTFNDVELYEGKEMLSTTEDSEPISDVQLLVLNAAEEPVKEILEDGTEIDYREYGDILPEDIPLDGKIPKSIWIAGVEDKTYTGVEITQSIRVYHHMTLLTAGKDYSIKYTNNTNAGTATLTVSGKKNFSGSITESFEIWKKDITEESLVFPDVVYLQKTNIYKSNPVLTSAVTGKKLTAGKDYYGTSDKKEPWKAIRYSYSEDTTITRIYNKKEHQFEVAANTIVNDADIIPIGTKIKAIVTAKGNYTGTKEGDFRIIGADIGKTTITVKPQVYNGGLAVTVDPADITVKSGKTSLEYGIDYEIVADGYRNNTMCGSASLTIRGIGDCSGVKTASFKINAFNLATYFTKEEGDRRISVVFSDMDGTGSDGEPEFIYEKGGVKPDPVVTFTAYTKNTDGSVNSTTVNLQAKKDYTIGYANNNKVAGWRLNNARGKSIAPTVTITGKGAFAGKLSATFTIIEKNLDDAIMTVPDVVYQAKGGIYKAQPVLKDKNGVKLIAGTDYSKTLRYTYVDDTPVKIVANKMLIDDGMRASNTEVGPTDVIPVGTRLRVTATAAGNYTGSKSAEFRIIAADVAKSSVSVKAKTYRGGEPVTVLPEDITVKFGKTPLVYGQDFEIVPDGYTNNTMKGMAKLKIRGINNCSGEKVVAFTIGAYDMNAEAGLSDEEKHIKIEFPDADEISAEGEPTFAYLKGGVKPIPRVVYMEHYTEEGTRKTKEILLVPNQDYIISYANNNKIAGWKSVDGKGKNIAPTVVITGKNAFGGKCQATFTIREKPLSEVMVSISDIVYQNKAGIYIATPVLKDQNGVKLVSGTDYEKNHSYVYEYDTVVEQVDGKTKKTVSRNAGEPVDAKDIIPMGTVIRVMVTGKACYKDSCEATFRFAKASLAKATVSITAQQYTGKEIRLAKSDITVKIGKTILGGGDYDIIGYSNNINTGNAKVYLRGVGAYCGEKTVNFKIAPRSMNHTVKYEINKDIALKQLRVRYNLTEDDAVARFAFSGNMAASSTPVGGKLSANKYKIYDKQTKQYITFAGWSLDKKGKGTRYADKGTFKMTWLQKILYGANVTLYAQWE